MGQRLGNADVPAAPWPMGSLPGAGLPHERLARMAAHQAFLEMRTQFLDALDGLPGCEIDGLRRDLRRSTDPADLWALRLAVHQALAGEGPEPTAAQSEFAHTLHTSFTGVQALR